MSLIIFSSMILYSCHTETPFNVDHESPSIQSLFLYSVDSVGNVDTLYHAIADSNGSLSDPTFSNFAGNQVLDEMDYNIDFVISDNYDLYEVSLCAKDAVHDSVKVLRVKALDIDGSYSFTIGKSDFPILQDETIQKFYLYLSITDESENAKKSQELGLNVFKEWIFDIFHEELGLLANTDNDPVDFREKIGKLAFIQFLAKG